MAGYLPDSINLGLGDTLWAVMVYLLIATVFCRWSIVRTALVALPFCYLIEISQLYHAPWIDAIRATRLGGLVLGFGFLWSDIISYTLGVGSAVLFESLAYRVPFLRNHLFMRIKSWGYATTKPITKHIPLLFERRGG
jgi:hypothetical protein